MKIKDPDPQLVKLITETVSDISDMKGYMAYPKEAEVRLVLIALNVVNEAIRRKHNELRRSGKSKDTG